MTKNEKTALRKCGGWLVPLDGTFLDPAFGARYFSCGARTVVARMVHPIVFWPQAERKEKERRKKKEEEQKISQKK